VRVPRWSGCSMINSMWGMVGLAEDSLKGAPNEAARIRAWGARAVQREGCRSASVRVFRNSTISLISVSLSAGLPPARPPNGGSVLTLA